MRSKTRHSRAGPNMNNVYTRPTQSAANEPAPKPVVCGRAASRTWRRNRPNSASSPSPKSLNWKGLRAKQLDKTLLALRATYSRKGGVRHFLAFYDLETDRLYGRFTTRKRWTEFLPFLKWVRSRYPREQKLHIVMDNYGPHMKEEVQTWAALNNIRFYLTPTNGSWLNRIECHFAGLKKFALQPSDHRTHEDQQQAIETYLTWRNRKRDLSL